MKNIETILTEAGIELTEEQKTSINKAVNENYKTITDYDKQVAKRDSYKEQYEEVKASLDKFDGVDVEGLKQQIEDAKKAVKDAEDKAKADLAARDYADAVAKHADTLTFSSMAAKKSFINDLKAKELKLDDGKLIGFDDFVKSFKETDKEAIVDKEAAAGRAKFTDPVKNGQGQQSETLRSALSSYYSK